MKTVSALAIAAALIGTPTLALAQATPPTLAPGLNQNLNNGNVLEDDVNGTDDQDQFIENLSTADFTSAVGALDDATNVTIIPVAEAAGTFNRVQPTDLDILRGRVSASVKAMQALEAAGFTVDQIVSIDAAGDGSVTLFVDRELMVEEMEEDEVS